ncbi:UDP-N-acetylglucosamine 1-carboxyvinyltransferase [Fervidicella metallireducens AeB]|uniref:UDP-N-acetylglucosamine 1-carboxyvinyltransferase n=1 Tax=Fervidicella metallireducens AeB TaxID=1403537 RepID=A0A017RRL6_9CLOT|nr:UDP-N-acetylglucosamine 1-carboxyvinyltransferase [Fervidicella metallireducens]EYE87413.1 UDP-N-acetylglucosamine 1-carboxyvinyltransferase [Fervidicella metallireducens AeB]
MEKLLIEGGRRLSGKVVISGAKNAAVAILPAAILADEGICKIDNLPEIDDIKCLKKIIGDLGAELLSEEKGSVTINPSGIKTHLAHRDEVKRMRASYYLLGALLAKFGRAEVVFPGGCSIGVRPIDQHIKGFEAMGAKVTIEHGIIKAYTENGLKGANIYLDVVSVGATINIMLAACKADGVTIIENAAKEPHVVDVANFLNTMGANIKGAGTDVIKITGVKHLKGCDYSVIPDQIEAGTFMIAAAATQGDVTLLNVIPKHLESISAKLIEMGVDIEEGEDNIRVYCNRRTKGVNIKTLPYPGFPTDIQQPMTTLLSISEGRSIVNESIWEGRFKHVDELKRMGANIKVEGKIAVIEGIEKLSGTEVMATDLRAGAAMIVAGLVADGNTYITNIKHIDRGYENIEDKFNKLGASIKRVKFEDEN